MSTLWKKITDTAIELKQTCLEQIWLLAMLVPLVLLASLGLVHWESSNSKNTHSKVETQVQIVASTEITSAELAMIVAKPIGELLAMQVYSVVLKGDELVALTAEDVFRNGASNKILITQHRRNQSSVVTYLQPLKNKKSQKVAEQS